MKRRFSLILSVVLAIALVAVIPFATMAFDQETEIGDVEDGYKPQGIAIHNATEFANMEPNGSYYIANDFEITATYAADFTGKLDGNGKILTVSAPIFKNLKGEVKNLKITGTVNVSDYDAGALAQRAENATVTNVLNHANVTGSTKVIALAESEYYNFKNIDKATGTLYNTHKLAGTGGFIGSATGVCVFTDCLNLGDVNGSPAGGIVGVMGYDTDASSFTFVNCHNEGKITDVGTDVTNMPRTYIKYYYTGIGGIGGFAVDFKTLSFDSCTNKGIVLSTLDATVMVSDESTAVYASTGGIMGGFARSLNTKTNAEATASFNDCLNEGAIGSKYNSGGIMGGTYDGIAAGGTFFTECVNKADITTTSSRCGGIAGETSKVTVTNCVNYGALSGTIHIGGMVGRTYSKGTFVSCVNEGSLSSEYTGSYKSAMGGIVGYVNSGVDAKDCHNKGSITAKYTGVGGIAGNVDAGSGTFDGCTNSGNITSTSSYVGGVVGDAVVAVTIKNSTNTGIFSGKAMVGGIIGYARADLTVESCENKAESITAQYRVGGIAGRAAGTTAISKCVNYANITSTGVDDDTVYVGGIAASVKTGLVSDCVNYGNLTATVNGYATGGIVGYYGVKNGGGEAMIRCGNQGTISSLGAWTGGLCGYVYGGTTDETTIDFCYNVADITGLNSVSGAIGYINTSHVTITNCFFAGTYTATKEGGFSSVVNYNNSNTSKTTNIYYSASLVATAEQSGSAGVKVALAPTVTDAQLASGELAYILNAAIKADDSTVTEDVFYQTLGTDAHPVLDNTHKAVLKLEDGSYANEIPAPPTDTETTPEETTPEETTPEETTPEETTPEETTPEETTPEETTPEETTPEETTPVVTPEETTPFVTPEETTPVVTPEETTPEETTPVVTPEETTPVVTPEETTPVVTPEETTPEETTVVDDGPIVGDNIGSVVIICVIAVVAIATGAAFVVIKRKENN